VSAGRLVVVGTPIGNLDDITARAVQSLRDADVIYCEDTRRTRKLLSAVGVPAPTLVRLDRHNEAFLAPQIADAVEAGSKAVLVTDAGMPTISDPGRIAVHEVAARGLVVQGVPGPSAVSLALALSGFDASRYRFLGFPPRKGRDRATFMAEIAAEPGTVVVYESPHRVARTLEDAAQECGPVRPVVVAHELTKRHEEVWRGDLGDAIEWLATRSEPPRGEWVVVFGPAPAVAREEATDEEILTALGEVDHLDRRGAVAEVAATLQVPRRRVYALAVTAKRSSPRLGMP
jgi:16S rRNA (cytidine1402-2'-O)-methyltransferase